MNVIQTIVGFPFTWYIYRKDKKDSDVRNLTKPVITFCRLEHETLKMVNEVKGYPEQAIQRNYVNR